MKTPITPFKMPLDLKEAAKKRAEEDDTNLTQLIIKLLMNT